MAILVSYDVSDNKQAEFKAEMVVRGYADAFPIGGAGKPLPESTLIKANGTERAATVDMAQVAQKLGIKLEKAVAVNVSGIEVYPP